MDGFLFIIAVVGALFAFDVLAARFGVDSTYESSDPASPVTGLSV